MLAVVCGVATPAADAQPQRSPSTVSAADAKKAQQLFEEGSKLAEKEKWAEAEAKFLAAWSLHPAVDIAVSLGQTQARLKKHRDAAEHLEYAIRNWSTVTKRDVRDRAVVRLAEMKKEIGTLVVKVNVAGASVKLGGRVIGAAPIEQELFVEPGEVTIEAQATGYRPAAQKVKAEKGKRHEVALALEAEAPAVATTAASAVPNASGAPSASAVPSVTATATASVAPPPPPPRSMVPAYVMGGVGLASVIAGAVLVGTAYSTNAGVNGKVPRDEMGNSLCQRPPVTGADLPSCVELRRRTSEANTFANAGIGVLITGGAIVGASVVYFLLSRGRGDLSPAPGRVVPVVGPTGGGLMIQGAF